MTQDIGESWRNVTSITVCHAGATMCATISMDIYGRNRKRERNGNIRLFSCDAFHYAFEADALPDACPSYHFDSILGLTDFGRRVTFPAVRPATEVKIRAYEDIGKTAYRERKFIDWVDNLPSYVLSDDEYHVALMLLHTFKTTPDLYTTLHKRPAPYQKWRHRRTSGTGYGV